MLDNLNELKAFITVAQCQSFTKAAAQLGVSQSALSHTIKTLETSLNIRLLHRTTRSVSTTDAGEQLLQSVEPLLTQIGSEMHRLTEFRNSLSGTIRIHATDHSIRMIWDRLFPLLQQHPEIQLEVATEYRFTDIVAERYDMGIRLGSHVNKDMIAVRICEDLELAVVASPAYFQKYPKPQTIDDLADHNCLNMRLPTKGGLMPWEFRMSDQQVVEKHVEGQFTFNQTPHIIKAAKEHLGLAWVPKDLVKDEIKNGELICVLEEYQMSYPGYHLYYPNRRDSSPIFRLIVDALKI